MPGFLQRASGWARRTPLHPQWLLGDDRGIARDMVREHARGLVLDIGCADRWAEPCVPDGCRYVGTDFLATGKILYGSNPDFFADASRLPIRADVVDTVLIFEVVEHLRDPQSALREIARILKPQGRLLLTLPFLYPIHDAPHDYQRYTLHGLMRELELAGLEAREVAPTLGSMESAGLLASIGMGSALVEAIRARSATIVLAPLLLFGILAVNCMASVAGRMFPSWSAMTAGYRVVASKP